MAFQPEHAVPECAEGGILSNKSFLATDNRNKLDFTLLGTGTEVGLAE